MKNPEAQFLVYELKLFVRDSSWIARVLTRLKFLITEAGRQLLEKIQEGLDVDIDKDGSLRGTDFSFLVGHKIADRVQELLSQERKLDKKGRPYEFSNSYRFIACEQVDREGKQFRVVSRLASSQMQEAKTTADVPQAPRLSLIPGTFLQGLLASFFWKDILHLPRLLRAGVCQEVAQQVTSHLKQIASTRVRGETSFPTIESRDPDARRRSYEEALDTLVTELEPLRQVKAREMFPGKFSADDPRGDRWVVNDERWFRVIRSVEPRSFNLFFVTSQAVKLLEGDAAFPLEVAKANRHAGRVSHGDPLVLKDRLREAQRRVEEAGEPRTAYGYKIGGGGVQPEQRQPHKTQLRSWYAALPILDCEDPVIQGILKERDLRAQAKTGRGFNLNLRSLPLMGMTKEPQLKGAMLVPLSAANKRLGRLLYRQDLQIAWTRLVHKRREWYLQLTLKVQHAAPLETCRVLGVSFGLDAVATWTLINRTDHQVEASGAFEPNRHIKEFLESKQSLEWDQKLQRWVGGRKFARRLESIAHKVANSLVELAKRHQAILAVEDIAWVPKSSPDSKQNVLFSAWNYGRLRRFLEYKAQLYGLGKPRLVSDYVTAFTCPSCGARRKPKEARDKAVTYRQNGELHCRKCGFAGQASPAQKSLRVALEALKA